MVNLKEYELQRIQVEDQIERLEEGLYDLDYLKQVYGEDCKLRVFDYDYDGYSIEVVKFREENDDEYEDRLKNLRKEKEKLALQRKQKRDAVKFAKEKEEQKERDLYLKLKEKYD
jgi:hypothetical protein